MLKKSLFLGGCLALGFTVLTSLALAQDQDSTQQDTAKSEQNTEQKTEQWPAPSEQLAVNEPQNAEGKTVADMGYQEAVIPQELFSIHAGVDSDTEYESRVVVYPALKDGFIREIRVYQGGYLVDRTQIGRGMGSLEFSTGYKSLVSVSGEFRPEPGKHSTLTITYPNFLLIPSSETFVLHYTGYEWRLYSDFSHPVQSVHVLAKRTLGVITGARMETR